MGDRRARDRSASPALRLSTGADTRHLEWLRRMVRAFLNGHGSPPEVVDDVELVVSELTTNVIRHTDSETLSVRLAAAAGHWILEVADAEDLPPLDDVTLPPSHAADGRGLSIAAALMDEITTVRADGRSFVRCRRSAPALSSSDRPGVAHDG